jgi:hypothetical protein
MTDNAKSKSPLVIRAQHTPGPWVYAERKSLNDRPCVTTVAHCCEYVIGLPSDIPGGNYRDGDPSGDPEADARLITAAPTLFDALMFASTDPCFSLLGTVTQDVIKIALLLATEGQITSGDEQRDEAAMVHEPFPGHSHFGG